jgi:hypothetical protein
MIYYPFFSDKGKEKIIKIILDEHYKDAFSDVILATDSIPVDIAKYKNIHQGSKIVLLLVDVVNNSFVQKYVNKLSTADEIWSTESKIVDYFLENDIQAQLLQIKHTPRLKYSRKNNNPHLDVLFYGSLDFYTSSIIKLLIDNGLKVFQTDNFDMFNSHISNTKIVLTLSPLPDMYQEQTIIQYLISNNKFVISEKRTVNYFPTIIEKDRYELVPEILSTLQKISTNS